MNHSNRTAAYFLLGTLAVIWGSSFILMKRGLESFTPAQVGTIRIFVSLLCMAPFLARAIRRIPRHLWIYLLATGWLGNGIPAILFPLSETQLSSSLAGMLNSLTPLFTFIVGISLFRMKVSQNRLLGLIIGLLGALWLVGSRGQEHGERNVFFASLIILATICYAFSVNIIRHKLAELDSLSIVSGALLMAGVPMGIYLFSTDFLPRLQAPGAGLNFFYVCILGAFGTAFSTVLFTRLVKISGALFAASVTYLIPIVAVLFGLADNETLSAVHFLSLGSILLGVYLISKKSS